MMLVQVAARYLYDRMTVPIVLLEAIQVAGIRALEEVQVGVKVRRMG